MVYTCTFWAPLLSFIMLTLLIAKRWECFYIIQYFKKHITKISDCSSSSILCSLITVRGISGTHAREWITITTVMYVLDQLMALPATDTLRKSFDWYIIPVVNPDGYEYARTSDRFWRKNRRPLSALQMRSTSHERDSHNGILKSSSSANNVQLNASNTYLGKTVRNDRSFSFLQRLFVDPSSEPKFTFCIDHAYCISQTA
jgi:hypothetical protein